MKRRLAISFLLLASLFPVVTSVAAEPEQAKKYALLVGVNDYDHADLTKLAYAVNDVAELRDLLVNAGYEVILLTSDEAQVRKDKGLAPTKANVEAHLTTLVKKFAKGDTLLIGLAGHGLQFEGDEDSYFCPVDARPFKDRTDTLVSIKWTYERLYKDAAAGAKLLLVDACRNDPRAGRGIEAGASPVPPKGVSVLLSCSSGQRSFERDKYKHGVFFHHVLEGLRGKARDADGAVTWDSLRSHVKNQVVRDEKEQSPEEAGRLTGAPPVLIGPGALAVADYDSTAGARFVHFSRDGIQVVLTYDDAPKKLFFARVYDAETGKPLTPPLRHDNVVSNAFFSPDGRRVVTTSWDKTARVWDVATGKQLHLLKHDGQVSYAAFSADGGQLATASNDKRAYVWDAQTGKIIGEPLRHQEDVSYVAFSHDGQRLVTAGRWASLWNPDFGTERTAFVGHKQAVYHASFSPDRRWVVSASADGTARIWDAETGKERTPPLQHKYPVVRAMFSPDGRRVATASADRTARIWDAETGKAITDPLKHESNVYRASFSADGRRLVTASEDKTARVWNAATGEPISPPLRHEGGVPLAALNTFGRRVVTVTFRMARVWDADTGKEVSKVTISAD